MAGHDTLELVKQVFYCLVSLCPVLCILFSVSSLLSLCSCIFHCSVHYIVCPLNSNNVALNKHNLVGGRKSSLQQYRYAYRRSTKRKKYIRPTLPTLPTLPISTYYTTHTYNLLLPTSNYHYLLPTTYYYLLPTTYYLPTTYLLPTY